MWNDGVAAPDGLHVVETGQSHESQPWQFSAGSPRLVDRRQVALAHVEKHRDTHLLHVRSETGASPIAVRSYASASASLTSTRARCAGGNGPQLRSMKSVTKLSTPPTRMVSAN